ncbi:MAG TPA: hypothetical protein VN715_17330 [Roseiarcus sp.]|nr:hypothetical protein [Roseiarcus sp.]
MTASAPARPVVIQTMWRTGGTYLAFALREQNPAALFYEPLHEDYSRRTKADWDGFAAAGAGASRGHPAKSFHYLTDFPFVAGGGVRGHRDEFAFRRFLLARGDAAPELAAYLSGLVESAAGRRPLFKFCRGFLRQPWLEARLGPVTVYLARHPAGMMTSYARIGGGDYFYSAYLRILKENRGEPILAPIYDAIARLHPDYGQADAAAAGDRLAGTVAPQARRDLFLLFWALALACHAAPHILTLDANALGADAGSRAESEEALRSRTGLAVDLADAAPLDPGEAAALNFHRPDAFGPWLRQAVAARAPGFDASRAPPPLRRQLEALLAAV